MILSRKVYLIKSNHIYLKRQLKDWQKDRQKDGDVDLFQICMFFSVWYYYCSSPGRPGWHFHAFQRPQDHLWLEDSQYISYIAVVHQSLGHSRYLKHTSDKSIHPKKMQCSIWAYMCTETNGLLQTHTYTHTLDIYQIELYCKVFLLFCPCTVFIQREREQGRAWDENTRGGEGVARLQGLRWEESFEDCPEAALVPGISNSASICDLTWGDRHKHRMMLSVCISVSVYLVEGVVVLMSLEWTQNIQNSLQNQNNCQTFWIRHWIFMKFEYEWMTNK